MGFSDSTTSVGNGDLTTAVALLALLWICMEFGRLLSVGLLMLLPVGSNILRKIYLQISLAQLSKQLIFSITSWRPSTTVADKQLTTVCLRPELIYPTPGWVLVMVVGGGWRWSVVRPWWWCFSWSSPLIPVPCSPVSSSDVLKLRFLNYRYETIRYSILTRTKTDAYIQ